MKYVDMKLGHQHKDNNQGAAFLESMVTKMPASFKLITLVGAFSVIVKSSRTIV